MLVLAGLALQPSAEARSFVIQADNRIGGYKVKKDGTIADASRVFGKPTKIRRHARFATCAYGWRPLGIRIAFANLGGQNPCNPQFGAFFRATITGGKWRTAGGLHVGDPWQSINRLHPQARPRGASDNSTWWLVTRQLPFQEPHAGLAARVRDGRVVAFVVTWFGAGD